MSHLVVGALLAAFLLYIAALYKSVQLALLGCCVAGIVAGALLLLAYRLWAVQLSLSGAMPLAERGKPSAVSFLVRARRPVLGKARLLARVEVRQLPRGRKKRTWIELETPRSGEEPVRSSLCLRCAGGYECRLRRVRVYDWTGLFFLGKRAKGRTVLHVLPAVHAFPLAVSGSVRGFFGEAEVYDDMRGGHDTSETFQIRAYAAGDKLQNIHWKLTAKTDELMVREHSLPKGCPVALLLGAPGGHQSVAGFDRFLQVAASLSFALIEAECPHIVSWYDGGEEKPVRTRVDDDEDFYGWQLLYMEAAGAGQGVSADIEERYMQDYRREPLLHRLRLEPDLKLYLDGKLFYAFAKSGDLAEEMGKLELYL